MTTRRAKTLVAFALFAGALLFAPKSSLADTTPQICRDGQAYLKADDFDRAIAALTQCLNTYSLGTENTAVAYYFRGGTYYSQALKILNADSDQWKKADKLFDKAMTDVEKSIEIDPTNAAEGYCLRGWIWLEISWGMVGWDDLDKGKAMGASEDRC